MWKKGTNSIACIIIQREREKSSDHADKRCFNPKEKNQKG